MSSLCYVSCTSKYRYLLETQTVHLYFFMKSKPITLSIEKPDTITSFVDKHLSCLTYEKYPQRDVIMSELAYSPACRITLLRFLGLACFALNLMSETTSASINCSLANVSLASHVDVGMLLSFIFDCPISDNVSLTLSRRSLNWVL